MGKISILIGFLLLGFAQASIAKDYSYRECKNLQNSVSVEGCKKCEEVGSAKIKINKQTKTIAIILNQNPLVITECNIFDEETFKCDEDLSDPYHYESTVASLSDGFFSKWRLYKYNTYASETFECAIEKKGLLNFFK